MENLTHSLTGVVLSRAGLGKRVPGGTWALVMVANLPDIDSVAGLGGRVAYFHHHRGIPHSLLGVAVLGIVCAALLWGVNRGRKNGLNTRFSAILTSVLVVLATHPLMDFTNSYGWRPFLPFSERWYYGDLVFIVDPYLWFILGGAVFLTATRSRVSRLFWIAGIAFLCYQITRYGWSAPEGVMVLSVWGLGIILFLGLKRIRPLWSPTVAWTALAGILMYWASLLAARQYALSLSYPEIQARYRPIAKEEIFALPRLANPLGWDLLFQDQQNVYYARVSIWEGGPSGFRSFARNVGHPAVQAALADRSAARMADFARFEFFEVVEESGGRRVILRDARYARDAPSGFGVFSIVVISSRYPSGSGK